MFTFFGDNKIVFQAAVVVDEIGGRGTGLKLQKCEITINSLEELAVRSVLIAVEAI